jgi:hypothetical protein
MNSNNASAGTASGNVKRELFEFLKHTQIPYIKSSNTTFDILIGKESCRIVPFSTAASDLKVLLQ